MSVQQNNYFVPCDDQKRKCSLPPKVTGNVCGFLTLKVGRIVWSMKSYKNVVITIGWWGESKPLILRPCIVDRNKFEKIGNEIIYEIRTDPKTFEQYLRDCESLEFNVINEEVNESIGKISVPDITSIMSESRYGGCFSVIDSKGFIAGDIYITFDLFLLQNHSLKEIRYQNNDRVGMYPYTQRGQFCKSVSAILKNRINDQISDLQNEEEFNLTNSKNLFKWLSCGGGGDEDDDHDDDDDDAVVHDNDKDDRALKQITSNNRSIEKADSELNDGIRKEFTAGMKEATPPDFIGGTVQHHEAVKQANSMRINILCLSLNETVVHQENTSLKNVRRNYNSLCQHVVSSSLPSKAAYFVEYEIPALLNITTNKSDISRNTCPWNRRIIRFCSRKQIGSEIYFGQSSVYRLLRRKGCWLENFKDLKIMMKVFLRNSNQRVPLQIGKATLEMCSIMDSESLSFNSESPVFSLAQVPHPFCIGKLKTKIELGRDGKYFGKEFFKVVGNEGSDCMKEEGTKKCAIQENNEEVFKELQLSEKEQEEQNKENLPEPKMKQQHVEKPLLLYGLTYISSGRGFNAMNSYVVSKSFWKEDIAVSNICWETSVPNYSLRELIPVLLSAEFLERCHNNFIIVEAWERKPVAQNDTLIGIAKLPLNQFFVAFRNPLLTEQLIQAKYPVVGVDGWVNVFNPVTRLQVGQLHAVLCLGTEDQIQLIERVCGIMETSYVPASMQPSNSMHYAFSSCATNPENFTNASVTQCQFNSGPKQIVSPNKSANRGNDKSRKEVHLNVHQQLKINQENAHTIKNENENLTNPPEALCIKRWDTSLALNTNAKPHSLKQNIDENKSTGNNEGYELSQSAHQEKSAEQILDTISAISVAENIKSNKLDTDKQQSNLSVAKVVDDIVCTEQTCTVKNQQCQTDLFVLDLQHYGPDFLTKHKNMEPLIIKLSSRGLEIIEMNERKTNAEILDKSCYSNSVKNEADKKQNQPQLDKNVICFKQHNSQSHSSSSAGEASYAFSFSGDKEHDILNSSDDAVAYENRGDSGSKFSTENNNSAKKNKCEVDNDHKTKLEHDAEKESKTVVCNSVQNSMKQHRTLAANGMTDSESMDSHLTCNTVEFMMNNQVHTCSNYSILEDESEGEQAHSGDFPVSQSEFACNTGSNNLLMDKCGLHKYAIKSNTSDQSSFNKKNVFRNTVNGKQEVSWSKNETNDHNHFENTEAATEVSGNVEFASYAHVTPEYAVVSANNNFCARIEIDEALNLSLHDSDEAGRNVYVSFHLNHGCAKVIIDGEVQLKTGLLFTPVVACNGNPVWNWHCEAWLPSDLLTDTSKQLIMKIWQKSNKSDDANPSADVLLGVASIDLTVILLGKPWLCDWFNIVNFTGSCIGHIKVSVTPQENLDRFRLGRINMLPDCSVTRSLIETSILKNTSYPQAANSDLERREHCRANVQNINCHLPERSSNTRICFEKDTKTVNKASSLANMKALKHEKNIPLGWDVDLLEESTSLLTKALRQKLSELDEITKRLKRRLLTVTSESVSPGSLVWEQEEANIPYYEKSNQKQKSSACTKNCIQVCTEAKVNSLKDGSCNATHTLQHRNCYCTQSSTTSQFQHSGNACELKRLDHLSNKMNFSKLSKVLDYKTSYEQMQCSCERISEPHFENQCLQCNESNADLEKGEKDLENNDTERGLNKDNDVEDFDALTDVLMETATKELDIANVFNPLLFQQLLLSNTNLIQRKCQRDKCSKQETGHNLSDRQNCSEITVKYDETSLTVCTVKEIDDKVQDNVSCSSENTNRQCSEKIYHSDLNLFHKMIEMDKFKKLGSHMISEEQQSYQKELVTNKRDCNDSPEISKQLAPFTDTSVIAGSSLNAVQTTCNLEKKCNPQQCHERKIPVNGQSYQHKASVSNEHKAQERFSEQELSENIETHEEEIESCSEFTGVTREQKLIKDNMKVGIEVKNTHAKNGGYDNKEYPSDLQRKQKQRSAVCRLAPLFFQKLNTEHE